MTDTRIAASPPAAAARTGGIMGFLTATAASLADRRLVVPMALLTVLLTGTNIYILENLPPPGEVTIPFAVAALVRVAGLFTLAVAILRVLNDSPRPLYRPDGAFWLYALTIAAGILVSGGLARLFGGREDALASAATGLGVIVLSAPFAAWFTAIAVERPLAAAPGPWLRGFGRWLPALILWSVVIVLPLGQLHAAIDHFLLRGAGDWFWPLALFDGPLSAVLGLAGLALASTAYRSVARG
ncbi:MAG TPA: hypothetical protein VGB08_07835 [Allosphingosinicella sp.]|jgi:hypothetical protein